MAETLRILTFNVLNEPATPGAFEARFDAITQLVVGLEPDVVCLQEMPNGEFVVRLTGLMVQKQHRAMFSACTRLERPDGWSETLAIIHPGVRRVARRVVSPNGARIGIGVTLAATGLNVFSVHLNPADAELRHAEAAAIIEALPVATLPVVVCGDFNAIPGGGTMRLLEERLQHLAPGAETERTFPTGIDGKYKDIDGVVFDHILGHGVEMLTSDLIGAEQVKGKWASDHIGVWATVRVNL